MTKKAIIRIIIYITGAAILCWGTWVTNTPLQNKVDILNNKAAIEKNDIRICTELKGVNKRLEIQYGLLKEIRDDQKKRR